MSLTNQSFQDMLCVVFDALIVLSACTKRLRSRAWAVDVCRDVELLLLDGLSKEQLKLEKMLKF